MSLAPNRFASLALDRCSERRDDLYWLQAAWLQARVVCVSFEGQVAVHGDRVLNVEAQGVCKSLPQEASFLGIDAKDAVWFALPADCAAIVPADTEWIDLRTAAQRLSDFDSGLAAYAKALLLWQTRVRFCGACGHPTERQQAGHSARCTHAHCGLVQYPKIDSAIITLVEHEDHCLLGRQASWPKGRYSTLAGFVEVGESLEDALRREVREEAGVEVIACAYHSTQPWPFPASLMLGFRAFASDRRLCVGSELEDARWVAARELIDGLRSGEYSLPAPISISHRLIREWLVRQCGEAATASALARRD